MRNFKHVLVSTLILSMITVLLPADAAVTQGAGKPKLSSSGVSIGVGKTRTIKVKNGAKKAKVSWKTSKKNVVQIIKKTTGGKKAMAKIKGKKAGKAVITANYKLGKKSLKLKCKVTVKDKAAKGKTAKGKTALPESSPGSSPAAKPAENVKETQVPGALEKPEPTPTVTPTAAVTPSAPPSAQMQEILDSIVIPDAEAVRGNITLQEESGGAVITWKSSNVNVITDTEIDGKAPGVVTRGADDQTVMLTATVKNGNETAEKTISVNVLKAPAAITEDDYAGYLFGHFIGESNADGEQIYFAVSSNRLNFTDMNGGKPVLRSTVGEEGVRDPYLYRSPEGDRYFLIATDLSIFHRGGWRVNEQGYFDPSTTGSHNLVLWESTDLVNWGTPKLIEVAPENAGMAWAPEMIYDDVTGQYIIFFASSIMDPETKYKAKPNAIYYVATRDFVNFSDTKLLIDNQTDGEQDGKAREIIDTTILKIGDTYYSASKDGDNTEKNGGIRIMKTGNLLDPTSWEKVCDLDELGLDLKGQRISSLTNATLEGPELFMLNKRDWADPQKPEYVLMADQYAAGAGYLPITTTDIEDTTGSSWNLLSSGSDYSFDRLKKRHGTVLRITQEELDRIKAAF